MRSISTFVRCVVAITFLVIIMALAVVIDMVRFAIYVCLRAVDMVQRRRALRNQPKAYAYVIRARAIEASKKA